MIQSILLPSNIDIDSIVDCNNNNNKNNGIKQKYDNIKLLLCDKLKQFVDYNNYPLY